VSTLLTVQPLPIKLHDFRLGVDKISAEAASVDPGRPRVRLRSFSRGISRQVRGAAPGELVFLRGMHVGLSQAAQDEFRLPLPGDLIRDESQQRFAGGLVAGALLHEWLRGDRRAASELGTMYDYGQGVGFQVNQHHLCARVDERTLLVHRVSCVYVEERHGAIPLHTEMFLIAWFLRTVGYRTDQIDMQQYLADRPRRWTWKPPATTSPGPPQPGHDVS
jgi:hypothetical protein